MSYLYDPRSSTVVEDRRVLLGGVERELRIYHVGSRQIWPERPE